MTKRRRELTGVCCLALISAKTVVEVLGRAGLSPLLVGRLLSPSSVAITAGTRRSRSVPHGLSTIASGRLGLRSGWIAALLSTILT